ncbi:MAG: hypothetical protein M1833_001082 [Piccolia ochrophora]|nr:MAG: hypothetical protein M1833_001082 [Piccolia ochrophora]
MAQKPLNVIVVGGSLGGLFTGIVLKRLGHRVRIFERNPTPLLQHQGAGIVAGGEAQAFFDSFDATRSQIAVPSHLRHYFDKKGQVIHEEHKLQRMTSWDLLYYVLRANFDRVQSDYCTVPDATEGEGDALYEYGHTVTDVREVDNHVEVDFHTKAGQKSRARADMVIAADGPGSTIRKILNPGVKRDYAGYVAWRGTVPEREVSTAVKEAFVEKFAFFHTAAIQILCYTIPGPKGTVEPGKRLLNWVWYCNYPKDSKEFDALMTDKEGTRHHITLPVGKMRDEIRKQQNEFAERILPPQFAELVVKTVQPFIQAITDVLPSQQTFFSGKVLLIGDALAGFRPHTAASTSQAALHALLLEQVLKGEISWKEYKDTSTQYAQRTSQAGIMMGDRSQFSHQ